MSRLSRGLFVPETPFHNISRMFGLGFDRVHTGQSQHTSLLILDPGPHTWLGVGPSYFKHQAYSCPQGELSASMLPLQTIVTRSCCVCVKTRKLTNKSISMWSVEGFTVFKVNKNEKVTIP